MEYYIRKENLLQFPINEVPSLFVGLDRLVHDLTELILCARIVYRVQTVVHFGDHLVKEVGAGKLREVNVASISHLLPQVLLALVHHGGGKVLHRGAQLQKSRCLISSLSIATEVKRAFT